MDVGIGLATTIMIAPYRVNGALIAKQAATVHHLSGGRLVLGAAVGGRVDAAFERAARHAGRAMGGGTPEQFTEGAALPDPAPPCGMKVLFPCDPDPDQVDLLADAALTPP